MTEVLKLKHIYPNDLPDQKFYFYEGECDVHYGVIELPKDPAFEHWAVRAWLRGYRLDPETGETVSRDELAKLLVSKSTESAEVANESSSAGGQPAGENGVRTSQRSRRSSVPK